MELGQCKIRPTELLNYGEIQSRFSKKESHKLEKVVKSAIFRTVNNIKPAITWEQTCRAGIAGGLSKFVIAKS